ncbi:hypothetical protein KAT92_06160 [Candidatus Babeliales bacterium]|nr:hypothetical protein [Candidatus Babeliales bacterium]
MSVSVNFSEPLNVEKKGNALQVSGTIMKTGTFQGANEDGSASEPTIWNADSIRKVFESIKTNRPLVLTHTYKGQGCPLNCGWSTMFSLRNNDTEIYFEGLVFNETAIKAVALEGFNHPSIEADLELTSGLVTSGDIDRIAFVERPAVKDTKPIIYKPIAFEDKTMSLDDTITEELKQLGLTEDQIGTIAEKHPNIVLDPDPKPDPKPDPDPNEGDEMSEEQTKKIDELEAKVAELTAENDELKTTNANNTETLDGIQKGKFDALINEAAELGIVDPGKIVDGLSMNQSIDVLNRLKETAIAGKSPVSGSGSPPEAGEGEGEATPASALAEVVEEMGMAPDQAKDLLGIEV